MIGLGEDNKSLTLYSDKTGSGLASLFQRDLDHFDLHLDSKEDVSIRTIDSFCKENSIQKIDFLKLDIEGNEINALIGAKDMLASSSISFIQFEFGGSNIDSRTYFHDFYTILNDKYHIYRILKDGVRKIDRYTEFNELFGVTNYIAVLRTLEFKDN